MPEGDIVFQRLRAATEPERALLAKILGIAPSGDREVDVVNLSKEYRSAAGHTMRNLFRKAHELEYRTILLDAVAAAAEGAGWAPPGVKDTAEDEWIENYVFEAFCFASNKQNGQLSAVQKAKAREQAEVMLMGRAQTADSLISAGLLATARVGTMAGAASAAAGIAGGAFTLGFAPALVIAGPLVLAIDPLFQPSAKKVLSATLVLIHVRKRAEVESQLSCKKGGRS